MLADALTVWVTAVLGSGVMLKAVVFAAPVTGPEAVVADTSVPSGPVSVVAKDVLTVSEPAPPVTLKISGVATASKFRVIVTPVNVPRLGSKALKEKLSLRLPLERLVAGMSEVCACDRAGLRPLCPLPHPAPSLL